MKDEDKEYTWEHMDAAACMWEYVIAQLRKHEKTPNPWGDYMVAYGTRELRETILRHATTIQDYWAKANENGYNGQFDWDFVPKYMEDHVTRILT